MKILQSIALILLLLSFTGKGQEIMPPETFADSMLINGVTTFVETALVSGDMDGVENAVQDFVKDHLDQRIREKDDVLTAEKVVINQVTDKRGDLLVYLFKQNNRVRINMAFQLGYDVYVDPHQYPEEYKRLQDFMKFFVYTYYSEMLPDAIGDAEKAIKRIEKDLKSHEKDIKRASSDNSRLAKKIKSNKKKIQKLKKKIEKAEDSDPDIAEMQVGVLELEKETAGYQEEIAFNNGVVEVKQAGVNDLQAKLKEKQAYRVKLQSMLEGIAQKKLDFQ